MTLVRIQVVSQLWLCEVPMSKLIMAKEYAKEVYANLQVSLEAPGAS